MTGRLIVLWILASVEAFLLQGPSGPLVAQLGGSVLLPCSAETPLPLEELEVQWRRTDSESLVHLFQEGEERPESQDYAYSGRAHFITEGVSTGNYSLLLTDVTRADAGVYMCKVYTNLNHSDITAEIQFERFLVTGAGVVSANVAEEVILNCSLDSHIPPENLEEVTWKRKRQKTLVLLYQHGEELLDASDEQYRGRAEFFTSEIPKGNFSLRLKDVRTEDKGEYICEVHSSHLSGNITVVLMGYSDLQKFILALCSISLVFSIGLIFWMFFRRKDTSPKALMIHFFLFLCPNILLGIGFITWGVIEGFLGEAAACSTVNFIRFLLLIITAPYLNSLPGHFKGFRTFSAKAEYSVVSVIVFSAVFVVISAQLNTGEKIVTGLKFSAVWILCVTAFITAALRGFKPLLQAARPRTGFDDFGGSCWEGVCLENANVSQMLVLLLRPNTFYFEFFIVTLSVSAVTLIHFMALLCCLCQTKNLNWLKSYVIIYVINVLSSSYVVFKNFGEYKELFIVNLVMSIIMLVLLWLQPTFLRITFGYLLWLTLIVIIFVPKISLISYYVSRILENDKEQVGLMTVMVFLQFLMSVTYLDHPEELPETCHALVYLLGASGLSIVNSITLMIELIYKTETGVRFIADLRKIVLPAECVFIGAWVLLRLYGAWLRHRLERTPDQRAQQSEMSPQGQEMEALSDLCNKHKD